MRRSANGKSSSWVSVSYAHEKADLKLSTQLRQVGLGGWHWFRGGWK